MRHHWTPRYHLSQSKWRARQHPPRHGHQVSVSSLKITALKSSHVLLPLTTTTLFFCFTLSRLGHKIQGVLCDGNSNEVVASTVVNCLSIDEGKTFRHFGNFYNFSSLSFFCFDLHHSGSVFFFFHRHYHHCEGGLCPCSKSQTDF